jgi:hypothetical protein
MTLRPTLFDRVVGPPVIRGRCRRRRGASRNGRLHAKSANAAIGTFFETKSHRHCTDNKPQAVKVMTVELLQPKPMNHQFFTTYRK